MSGSRVRDGKEIISNMVKLLLATTTGYPPGGGFCPSRVLLNTVDGVAELTKAPVGPEALLRHSDILYIHVECVAHLRSITPFNDICSIAHRANF